MAMHTCDTDVDDDCPSFMDGADGPIYREIREDGALVMTQGDTVWVTPAYDMTRHVKHDRQQRESGNDNQTFEIGQGK